MPEITSEPGPVDPTTGTRRLDLWIEDADGGAYGDNAFGKAWTARYIGDDGARCAEIAVYVESTGQSEPDAEGEPVYRYGVTMRTTVGDAVKDDDGDLRPSDSADIEYEPVGYFDYETEAEAQKLADSEGRKDLSWALYLRKPTKEG